MPDRGHDLVEIERTVMQVRGAWYRAGVPRRVRQRRAEELEAHLVDQVAAGGAVRDVTGDDLMAFAAEWAAAEASHPVLALVLQVAAALTLIPGVVALLNPRLHDLLWTTDDRVGIPVGLLALLAVMIPFFAGWQILRIWRHRLSARAAGILLASLLLVYAGMLGAWSAWGRGTDLLVPLPASAAGLLIAVGAIAQAFASWLRHRPDRLR